MINIILKENEITVSGHANYNEYGTDIVCASASSIIYTTINAIKNFDSSAVEVVDKSTLKIKILKKTHEVNILLNNMIELLYDLEKQYKNNLKIKKGE